MLAQEMLAQELAARFGPKLREIEPLFGNGYRPRMSRPSRVIEQAEATHSRRVVDDGGSRSDADEMLGK